jgi:hypothetical protein
LVCEEDVPDPRNQGHRDRPQRIPSFGHQFDALHASVVGDDREDRSFYTGISHKAKVSYICEALRLSRGAFNLDLPLPLEDWALSDDMSLITSGLYVGVLRREFYERLFGERPDLRHGAAWAHHADAEFWSSEFNRIIHKRGQGVLIEDARVLN